MSRTEKKIVHPYLKITNLINKITRILSAKNLYNPNYMELNKVFAIVAKFSKDPTTKN